MAEIIRTCVQVCCWPCRTPARVAPDSQRPVADNNVTDTGRNTHEDSRPTTPITAQPAGLAILTPQRSLKPEDEFENQISKLCSTRKLELLRLLITRVKNSLQTEGIYRKSPLQELKCQTIKALCDQARLEISFNIDTETQVRQNEPVAILTASLVKVVCKTILAETEMDKLLAEYSAVHDSEEERILALRTTISNFPEDTQHLLITLITHLSQDVVSNAVINRMDAQNLGVVIGQNLFNFKDLDKSCANMVNANAATAFLIAHAIPNARQQADDASILSGESSDFASDSPPPTPNEFEMGALYAEQSTPHRPTTAVTPRRIQVTAYNPRESVSA